MCIKLGRVFVFGPWPKCVFNGSGNNINNAVGAGGLSESTDKTKNAWFGP